MIKQLAVKLAWGLALSPMLAWPAFAQIETARHPIDSSLDGGFWVQTVDFDQDGDMDLVTASLRESLKWYENDGQGAFQRHHVTSFPGAWAVHANDFDNDGDLDLVAISPELNETAWFERKSDGSFAKHIIDDASLEPHSVYSADMDSDGDFDVLVAVWDTKQVLLWENRGPNDFRKHVLDNDLSSAHSVYAADLDGDGDIEALAAGGGKTVYYRNDGGLKFKTKQVGSRGGFSVFAADVDGDGALDILRNQRDNGDIDWFRNSGGLNFSEKTVKSAFGETWSIDVGDLDLNGEPDVVTAGFAPNRVSAWLNDGTGSFEEFVLDDDLVRPRGVALGDLDGDHDLDIVAVSRTDRLIWYEVLGSPVIPTLTLREPNGGERIDVSSEFTIGWHSEGSISKVDLQYSTDGGASWDTIITAAPNAGSYSWSVPETASQQALVRVTKAGDSSIADASDAPFAIVRSSLTLTAPNGNEIWFGGSSQSITWNSTAGIDFVSLAYSLDDGFGWTIIAEDLPNSGSYNWNVPNRPSQHVRVRVSDTIDGTPADVSDSAFSIVQSSVTILSPNGGESWSGATTQPISWTTQGAVERVAIEYSLDAGASWQTLVENQPNSGSFEWSLPNVATSSALVRLFSPENSLPLDISDDAFAITPRTLTLASPNGGEVLTGGSQNTISWTQVGTIDVVKLEYSLNAGIDWLPIATQIADQQSFEWTVPDVATAAAHVRVSAATNDALSDQSDRAFAITGSSLTLASPNGGERWPGGTIQTIAWQANGSVESVKLEYSINGGADWQIIVASTDNSGSYQWEIPDLAADTVLAKISDSRDGVPEDLSDGAFSIVKPARTLTVTSPNGSEFWSGETDKKILWSSTGAIPSVKLEFSWDNGGSWFEIASSVPNTGQYEWTVPDVQSVQVLIRVSDAGSGTPSDISDAPFTIISSSLRLLTPNGGEEWLAATSQTIRWTSTGVISQVKLQYSVDSGVSWQTLVSTPNTGSYHWIVPRTRSARALVRISDVRDGNPADQSDAAFKIIDNPTNVKLVNPQGKFPEQFALFQNYPNPFNPTTNIHFAIPRKSHVTLSVYNFLGQPVVTLVVTELQAGEYTIEWDASELPSGSYFYRMQTEEFSWTRRLTLLK